MADETWPDSPMSEFDAKTDNSRVEGFLTDMEPCPFCGETKRLQLSRDSDMIARVTCWTCAANGPKGQELRSLEAWNVRKVENFKEICVDVAVPPAITLPDHASLLVSKRFVIGSLLLGLFIFALGLVCLFVG